jgi:signal transduction histidine kinase
VRAIAAGLIAAAALAVCWTTAYLITSYVYGRIGYRPHELVGLLVNAALGLFLFGGAIGLISLVSFPRHKARFQAILEAMRRLSRGDYTVRLHVMRDDGGQFDRLVRSINDLAVQLGDMEKMRQEFIANVSHEIQSPLASIRGFARALRDGRLGDEERRRYLDIIEAESMRLSRLSDHMLQLAALESEHPPFEPQRYRLDRQLREAVLNCEPQWLDKRIDMAVQLEEIEIVADPDLLNQVWGNLLHNSIKFTPDGGTIGIRLQRGDGEAIVRISDTGIGIGEEDLPRIFERFHKADRSRSRNGGSGLGLAIVKKIVDLHRGSIEVWSRPGEGTVFTVRLPTSR